MADPMSYRQRLLGLLPRIYTAQPDGSAIGALLTAMARALAGLDDDLAGVLHDRWVALANGMAPDGGASALDRLAQLFDLSRFDHGPIADQEAVETFRRRLRITAEVLSKGLTTPPAILSLALATLGADPCPLLWIDRNATHAWGMAPGSRRSCPLCHGGALARPTDGSVCPRRAQARITAEIVENPLESETSMARSLHLRRPVPITSVSLLEDRPVLTLRAPEQDVPYPALQNIATGETVLYAGILRRGDTLTVWPALTDQQHAAFDHDESSLHHGWLADHPDGQAILTRADGAVEDVSGSIFYLWGYRFDDVAATFGGASAEGVPFAVIEATITTPLLRPGTDDWQALSLGAPESVFDDSTSVFAAADALAGTRFAMIDAAGADLDAARVTALLDAMRLAESADALPDAVLDVRFDWFALRPATFRLRIPFNEAVASAERRGAVDAMLAAVGQARAAGVRAIIELPRSPPREINQLQDRAVRIRVRHNEREPAVAMETTSRLRVAVRFGEDNELDGRGIALAGVCDDTQRDNLTLA